MGRARTEKAKRGGRGRATEGGERAPGAAASPSRSMHRRWEGRRRRVAAISPSRSRGLHRRSCPHGSLARRRSEEEGESMTDDSSSVRMSSGGSDRVPLHPKGNSLSNPSSSAWWWTTTAAPLPSTTAAPMASTGAGRGSEWRAAPRARCLREAGEGGHEVPQ